MPNAQPQSPSIDLSFYRSLYELANDGIVLLQGSHFIDCNQRLLDLLQRSRNQVIGQTPWAISPPQQSDGQDSEARARAYIKRGFSGKRQVFEWVHTRGDGQPIDIEVSLSLMPDGDKPTLLCNLRDIRQRKIMERALRNSEEHYRRIVQDQTDLIVRWRPDGHVSFGNDSYCRYFKQSRLTKTSLNHLTNITPDDRKSVLEKIQRLTPESPVATDEHRVLLPNGEIHWQHWIDRGFFDDQSRLIELQSVGRDIDEDKQTQEALRISEEKFSKAFRWTPEAIMITRQIDGSIVDVNEGFERYTGYQADEVLGRTTLEIGLWAEPEQRHLLIEPLQEQGSVHDLEIKVRIKSGAIRHCLTSAETIEVDGEPCLVTVTRDVTENKQATERLEYLAHHDTLTALPNRNWLKAQIHQQLSEAESHHAPFAIVLMDLDRFKEINNTLGHHTGDKLLQQIGPRLEPLLRPHRASIARLGGDEFAMLIPQRSDRESVSRTITEILNRLKQPFDADGLQLEIEASLGIALYPENGNTAEVLLRCADVAMYLAKETCSGFAFYQPDKDRHSPRRLALMSELRTAIHDNQLLLHYQPQIDMRKQQVSGFEALVRWQHPVHGQIPPNQFIPFAELGESIHHLTYWVMEQAMRQCKHWHEKGKSFSVSLNLSTRNLLDDDCHRRLEHLLKQTNLDPGFVDLEITESALISDPERALKNLRKIHACGVQLSIDDFGTGYSSMTYLKRMPLHRLKIDMSFVQHMLTSEQDSVIVKSITQLAHNLDLTVVAEGIENQEILSTLRGVGCDYGQGFFIGKPKPAIDLINPASIYRP